MFSRALGSTISCFTCYFNFWREPHEYSSWLQWIEPLSKSRWEVNWCNLNFKWTIPLRGHYSCSSRLNLCSKHQTSCSCSFFAFLLKTTASCACGDKSIPIFFIAGLKTALLSHLVSARGIMWQILPFSSNKYISNRRTCTWEGEKKCRRYKWKNPHCYCINNSCLNPFKYCRS